MYFRLYIKAIFYIELKKSKNKAKVRERDRERERERERGRESKNQRNRKQRQVLGPYLRTEKLLEREGDGDTNCN